MIATQAKKKTKMQINKTSKQKQATETEYARSKRVYVQFDMYMYDEVSCCVCQNFENSEIFAKDLIQHRQGSRHKI